MKFIVQKVLGKARLGLIAEGERLPAIKVESPNMLLYARGGALPYLTEDVLQHITKEHVILYIPVPGIINLHERMSKYSGNVASFVGMPKYLTYVTVVDSGEKRKPGYHKKNYLSLWSKCGKIEINAETYMKFMEALKPDLFTIMSDSDTDISSSKNRIAKSVDRSLDFYEKCIQLLKQTELLGKTKIVASLVGGFNTEAREKYSAAISKGPIFAVSVDGLHDCSREVEFIKGEQITPLVEASLKHISLDTLKICHGSWNPSTLLDLVSCGIDIFDSSYPYIAAEEGKAFIFSNEDNIYLESQENTVLQNGYAVEEDHKNIKASVSCFNSCKGTDEPANEKLITTNTTGFYISLKEEIYRENLEPISNHCTCLTCKNHTKAYIHHLLNVKELLGPTLLIIHNIHHYLKFFDTIRTSLRNGKFEKLKHNFQRKYCSFIIPPDD